MSTPESVQVLRVMLDQIDGDPRALQFFDQRLIARARQAINKPDTLIPEPVEHVEPHGAALPVRRDDAEAREAAQSPVRVTRLFF